MIQSCLILTDQDKEKIQNGKVSEFPRMKDNQIRSARALIKEICCNYDPATGGCLLLDQGEVVPCPQMISYSLCCKHFRNVLLEDKRAKELKAAIFDDANRKICAVCGGHFVAVSNRAKYCTRCAKEVRKMQKRDYITQKRADV